MTIKEAKKYLEDYIQNPDYMHSSYVGNVVRPSIKTAIKALEITDRLENIELPSLEDYEPRYMQGFLDGWCKAIDTIRGDDNGLFE